MTDSPRPILRTGVGLGGYDVNTFFGFDIVAELNGHSTMAGLCGLAVGGRRLSPEAAALLDAAFGASLLADPRIWPLKATRLSACYGSYMHGLATGLTIQDCRLVGGPAGATPAAALLLELEAGLGEHLDDEEALARWVRERLARDPILPGFGVPLRERDVRVDALEKAVAQGGGRYWRLHRALVRIVAEERRLPANVAGGVAAIFLDLGFAPEEIGPLALVASLVSVLANAVEESRQKNALLQSLPVERVRYLGVGPRESPRALAAASRTAPP